MTGSAHTGTSTANHGDSLAARWAALHEAGREIGRLAALAPEPFSDALSSFPERIESQGGARLALARDGVADLDAILRPGLIALRTIEARGQDVTAPALALWREFHALRAALLALVIEAESAQATVAA